jgi:hypothetical protein
MVTKLMNKWMFTYCKYKCFPFHYVYLMQGFHHILLDMNISNDAKLNMTDGVYTGF